MNVQMTTDVVDIRPLALKQLLKLLDQKGLVAIFVTITPEVAAYILDNLNTHNRPSKPRIVERYRKAMLKKDGWKLNGETIVFTDRRRLGNGQNRLMACRTSGASFDTLVVFGIEDAAWITTDIGKPKDHADMLTLKGSKHARDAAIAVRWVEWIKSRKVMQRPLYTQQETAELYDRYKGVEDFIVEAKKIGHATKLSPGMVACFLYQFHEIDSELAAEFTIHWQEGICPPRFRAISALGAELEHMRHTGQKGGHRHEITRAAMVANAWNIVRKGRERGFSIKWDYDSQLFPEIV